MATFIALLQTIIGLFNEGGGMRNSCSTRCFLVLLAIVTSAVVGCESERTDQISAISQQGGEASSIEAVGDAPAAQDEPGADKAGKPQAPVGVEDEKPDTTIAFAAADVGGVRIYEATSEALLLVRDVEIDGKPISLVWLDDTRQAVLSELRPSRRDQKAEYALLIIEGDEVEEVELPEAEAWATEVGSHGDAPAHHRGGTLLVTEDGELWMQRCSQVYLGDANPCGLYVDVRVLPSIDTDASPPEVNEVTLENYEVDAPEGYDFETIDFGNYTSQLRCRSDEGKVSFWPPLDPETGKPEESADLSFEVVWLSADPPVYAAVEMEVSGEGRDSHRLFRGCSSKPDFEGSIRRWEFGSPGVWAAFAFPYLRYDDRQWHIYVDYGRVGGVKANVIAFAPND